MKKNNKYKIFVNLSTGFFPAELPKFVDGVGTLRSEMFIKSAFEKSLVWYVRHHKESSIRAKALDLLREVAKAFYPKPVWYRLTDEDDEYYSTLSKEQQRLFNHSMGVRGVRLALREPALLQFELTLISTLIQEGYDNLGIKVPMVDHPLQIRHIRKTIEKFGLKVGKDLKLGITLEIPAAAIMIDDLLKEGLDFVTIGVDDLTSFTLGMDRENSDLNGFFKIEHPAVIKLVTKVGRSCSRHGVQCLLSGDSWLVKELIMKTLYTMGGICIGTTDTQRVVALRDFFEKELYE